MKELLDTITSLSHEFGAPDYVKGGGGNTSAKSADTLWVKPSGTTLAGMTPENFVAMDRRALGRLYGEALPAEPAAREAKVKDLMAAAVGAGPSARPSVEAPLHDVLAATYVVHTHPALVNGLTCARSGAAACSRLFPDALWIPYIDPGYTLCMDVRRRAQDYARRRGTPPAVLLLENHGLFVTGDSADGIRRAYRRVMDALRAEYAGAGVTPVLPAGPMPSDGRVREVRARLADLLGAEAAEVAVSGPFPVAPGPISPDHIVYATSYPYEGPLTREGMDAFRARRGYAPRVVAQPDGVFGVGPTPKVAGLALELALDGALVAHLAAAFGGIQFMTDRARDFIEHWEVESYRQKQMQ